LSTILLFFRAENREPGALLISADYCDFGCGHTVFAVGVFLSSYSLTSFLWEVHGAKSAIADVNANRG
jgi:hypothetical protein